MLYLKPTKEILKRDHFIESWLNYHSKNNSFKFSFINRHGTIKMVIHFIKKQFIKNITSKHFSHSSQMTKLFLHYYWFITELLNPCFLRSLSRNGTKYPRVTFVGMIKDKDLLFYYSLKNIIVNISKLASCGLAFFPVFLKLNFGELCLYISPTVNMFARSF